MKNSVTRSMRHAVRTVEVIALMSLLALWLGYCRPQFIRELEGARMCKTLWQGSRELDDLDLFLLKTNINILNNQLFGRKIRCRQHCDR